MAHANKKLFDFDRKFDFTSTSNNSTLKNKSQTTTSLSTTTTTTRSKGKGKDPAADTSSKAKSILLKTPIESDLGKFGVTFADYHKKKNIKFSHQDPQARVEGRLNQFEDRRKLKREHIVMNNRQIDSEIILKCQESTAASKKERNGSIENLDRKEKLEKWKQERATLKSKTKVNEAKPFKVGIRNGSAVVQPSKFCPPPLLLPPVPVIKTKTVLSNNVKIAPPTSKKNNNIPAPAEEKKKKVPIPIGQERRVTRAFAKANQPQQPIIKKMEGLAITTNKKPIQSAKDTKPKMTIPTTPKLLTSQRNKEVKIQPPSKLVKEKVVQHSNSNNNVLEIQQTKKPPAAAPQVLPIPPQRKLKGMQFDDTYKTFNELFVKSCCELKDHIDFWTSILATNKEGENNVQIPSDIQEDIEAFIGQAKLLMESKLPQFAELLYFYLSKHKDPGLVLACDLQGWWDVAVIQVDKVNENFKNVTVLQNNGWVRKVIGNISTVSKTLPSLINPTKKLETNSAELKEIKKVGASQGLRAFLAMKRNKKEAPAAAEIEKSLVNIENAIVEEEEEIDHKFEGGFFQIQSPLSKKFQSQVVNVNSPTKRASRRLSSSSSHKLSSITPLKMLAVRTSMGSIAKLGSGFSNRSQRNGNDDDEFMQI